MSFYITDSECGGRRPAHLESGQHFPRIDLLAALLEQRHAARFVVAPPCFGKTLLVAEYAKSVFAFESTFWIRAQSPNFIRDLDKTEIASSILQSGVSPGLVVFDDVPRLSTKRAKAFSDVLDQLMECGWEVILIMSPSCDVYGKLQSDRVLLESRHLLVSDDEIMRVRSDADLERKPAASYQQLERIPCFFWQEDVPIEDIYKKLLAEDLPTEMQLYLFVLLVLGKGDLETVSRYIPTCSQKILFHLERYYLYLGITIQEDLFSAYLIPVKDIAKRFFSLLDRMKTKSSASSKDDLVTMLADALIEEGNSPRACQVMRLLAGVAYRKEWLEKQGQSLSRSACFYDAYLVYESLGLAKARNAPSLVAAHVWRLHYLGDADLACRLAGRVLHMSSATDGERALAALYMAQEGNEVSRTRAYELLDDLIGFSGIVEESEDGYFIEQLCERVDSDWKLIVAGYLCIKQGLDRGTSFLRQADCSADVTAILAAQLIRSLCVLGDASKNADTTNGLGMIRHDEIICRTIAYLQEVESFPEATDPLFSQVLLFRILNEAIRLFNSPRPVDLSRPTRLAIHRIEMLVFAQRNSYEQSMREAEVSKRESYVEQQTPAKEEGVLAPIMHVKLFGGVEVTIGKRRIDPSLLGRKKDKALLAILVLNRGKEISRERLLESLWPDLDPQVSLRNFYAVWSRLKRAFADSSGNCPYLVRMQSSCMINADLVQSDTSEFDQMCRKLSFGSADISVWEHYYERLANLYADDLVPGEYDNEIIVSARNEYRDRMVDACVTGASFLLEREKPNAALWFARLAIERDRTREDAYEVLMMSQLGAGQRTAALGTFLKCKGYLAEELGIDPPARLTNLFDRITNEDPSLGDLGSRRFMVSGVGEV